MKISAIQNKYYNPVRFKANEEVKKQEQANPKVYKLPELDDDKKLAMQIVGGAVVLAGVCYAGYKGLLGKSVQKLFRGNDYVDANEVKKAVAEPVYANVFERMGVKVSEEELNKYNKFKEDVDTIFNKKMPISDTEDAIEILLKNNDINLEIPMEKWSKKALAYMDYSCTKFYDNYYDGVFLDGNPAHFLGQRLKVQIGVKDFKGAENTGRELVLSIIDLDKNIEGLELLNKMAADMGEPKKYASIFNLFADSCTQFYKEMYSAGRASMCEYEVKCAEALPRLEELFAPVYGDDNRGIKAIRECLNK